MPPPMMINRGCRATWCLRLFKVIPCNLNMREVALYTRNRCDTLRHPNIQKNFVLSCATLLKEVIYKKKATTFSLKIKDWLIYIDE